MRHRPILPFHSGDFRSGQALPLIIADGFGIAFFEDKACRLFVDNQSAVESPIAELVRNYPIKSRNVIAHIRKATQGKINLENSHPFSRELWGRQWIFAHNGDLHDFFLNYQDALHQWAIPTVNVPFVIYWINW